jgi:hypothetical protein
MDHQDRETVSEYLVVQVHVAQLTEHVDQLAEFANQALGDRIDGLIAYATK